MTIPPPTYEDLVYLQHLDSYYSSLERELEFIKADQPHLRNRAETIEHILALIRLLKESLDNLAFRAVYKPETPHFYTTAIMNRRLERLLLNTPIPDFSKITPRNDEERAIQ